MRHDGREEIELSDVATAVVPMGRDLRQAAKFLGKREGRFLVDTYYLIQTQRIRTGNQMKQIAKGGEPVGVIQWVNDQFATVEEQIKASLDVFSRATLVGEWVRSQKGLGPVITSGLLAHLDIERAPTVGHFWSFAGIEATSKWEKGEKRPWNADLKRLCYLLGESFVKVSGKAEGFYGLVYAERKKRYGLLNVQGAFRDQALAAVAKYGKGTEALTWASGTWVFDPKRYEAATKQGMTVAQLKTLQEEQEPYPMLPPAHIHARARRAAVKLFLSHLHEIWHFVQYGRLPPLPYPIAHLPGHTHLIAVPGGEMIPGYIEARKALGPIASKRREPDER